MILSLTQSNLGRPLKEMIQEKLQFPPSAALDRMHILSRGERNLKSRMEFRPRDYSAEAKLFLLHRDRAEIHPLSDQSSQQDNIADDQILRYDDPLRADDNATVSGSYLEDIENSPTIGVPSESTFLPVGKEWSSFTRFMTQRFPVSKLVSVTSELEDPQIITENEVKVITRQDYINRLREFKDDLIRAWNASDRVTSLKISVKVSFA
ncbi:unnamed protein product [Citrullus colocynthis]|uniref:Uncharacterized protein n=1 Tax=Citrullus colocynthis TaxID=252529 RepID=A0ABP0XN61_9ROSI